MTKGAMVSKQIEKDKEIAAKNRLAQEKIAKRTAGIEQYKARSQHLKNAAGATKDLVTSYLGLSANDPDFYTKFETTKRAAEIPTFFRAGIPLYPEWLHSTNATSDEYDNLPGIMVFLYRPTLPNNYLSTSANNLSYRRSPLNETLVRFMAELRKKNSRIGDYDPGDIGFYVYALSGIMEEICRIRKALRFYNTYFAVNANYARVMITSIGFDWSDFIQHVPEYQLLVTKAIKIFNSNAVMPKTMTFFKRRFWLASAVIKDHTGNNAQIYTFNSPYTVYLDTSETRVNISAKVTYLGTYASNSSNLNLMMENLFNSVGMVTIIADLRAAFNDAELLKLQPFDTNEEIQFMDSDYDRHQVHNLITLPTIKSRWMVKNPGLINLNYQNDYHPGIIQDSDGYLVNGAYVSGNLEPMYFTISSAGAAERCLAYDYSIGRHYKDKGYLNFYDLEKPTTNDIIESTRLRFTAFPMDTSGAAKFWLEYCGTEVVTEGLLWVYDPLSDSIDYYQYTTDIIWDTNDQPTMESMSLISRFDWLPLVRFSDYIDATTHGFTTFGEIDHPVMYSREQLRWLHDGAALSLFYIESKEFGDIK